MVSKVELSYCGKSSRLDMFWHNHLKARLYDRHLLNYSKQFKAVNISAESLRGHLDEVSEFSDLNSLMWWHMTVSKLWMKTINKSCKVSLILCINFSLRYEIQIAGEWQYTWKKGWRQSFYTQIQVKNLFGQNNSWYVIIILLSSSDMLPLCVPTGREGGTSTDQKNINSLAPPSCHHVWTLGDFYSDWPKTTN